MTIDELKEALETLKSARAMGAKRVRISDDEREIEFKNDAEMLAAINALQDEIEGQGRPRAIKIRSSKGW